MNWIEVLAGPLIGAVIGYCTNYIAVKMLFRPLKAVKIGNWTLPFTPGIIPRGQARIAQALGNAVGKHLLTKEDITRMLLEKDTRDTVVNAVAGGIREIQNRQDTVEEFLGHYVEKEDYDGIKEKLEDLITEKINSGLEKLDLGDLIAREGAKEVQERFQGSMVSMFLNEEMISSIAVPIGNRVSTYIRENGKEKIHPLVVGEMAAAENQPVSELIHHIPLKGEKVKELVEHAYIKFVQEQAEEIAEKFHVEQVVEMKVRDMDVLEVEHLLLGVMKKELNAVVNLGALIGFLIGLLNLLL